MDQPVQKVVGGRLQTTIDGELQQFLEDRIVPRFWAKDASIWPPTESQKTLPHSHLGWLDFPDTLFPLFRELTQTGDSALCDGLTDWVFLALGNAGLAARSLLPFLSLPANRRFLLLDSGHPSTVRRLQDSLDLSRTGFILASKGGEKLEDQALFLHFQHLLEMSNAGDVSRRFAAQTQPNSFLSALSRGYSFRASFLDPPNVPSSYCSLLHFGALLVGLSVIDAEDVLSSARATRQLCSVSSASNPALQLAAFLSTATLATCRYLVFFSSPSLAPYSYRLGHLIGGSLTQSSVELIPICGDVPLSTDGFQDAAVFVFLTLQGQDTPEIHEKMRFFEDSNTPFVHIHIQDVAQLLPETFKWEIATALACASLGLSPFDWPEVLYPRRVAMDLLENLPTNPKALERSPRLQESGIQLFAEARTRSEISTLNLLESFRSFFRLRQSHGFLVLLVLLERTPAIEAAVHQIRELLTRQLGLPVVSLFGPRCFDQYAYLCRTGVSEALFIALTADYPIDLPIPGADYSFSKLHFALCQGEYEAIVHSERFVIRINLMGDVVESLANLEHLFAKALSQSH